MRFKLIRPYLLVTAIIGLGAFKPTDATAQKQLPPGAGWRASAVEAAQLPKFCWGQYLGAKGPEYEIPTADCGWGMNHYCYGLVELLRANKSFGDRNLRIAYLKNALDDTIYTMHAMEKFPTCRLRSHVENTYQQVQTSLHIYGVK
jgi:hypothetical protein